jgi:LmbE family N-acetylglucosaminyl deacetylase
MNGIPVVAHAVGGIPEAAGGAAVLVEPPRVGGTQVFPTLEPSVLDEAARALAAEIERLLDDRDAYRNAAARGRNAAERTRKRAERHFGRSLRGWQVPDRDKRNTLILAPHADDAALSVAAAARGPRVVVATVFGRSNYTREGEFHRGSRRITARRRAEDARWTRAVGVSWRWLALPEAGLRIGASFAHVFAAQDDTDQASPPELAEELARLFDQTAPRVVFAPLGLGLHIDHLAVRNVARLLARERRIPVVFYEDLPYANSLSEHAIARFVRAFDRALHPVYLPLGEGLEEKLSRLALYPSQLGAEEISSVRAHAGRWGEPAERVWSRVLASRLGSAGGALPEHLRRGKAAI